MRKKVTVLLLTVATVFSLTACGKFTCDGCKEEKTGKSYTVSFMDEKMTLCKDCKEEWDALKKEVQGMLK